MHYLIDGHNLIAKMAGIRLSDPDDEEQLVRRLRSWMAAGRKRRVTLFFDRGLPGGEARHLSGASLQVVFASLNRDADNLLIRRINRARNAPEFTVVTSDRVIIAAAEARGMPVISSQDFAQLVESEAQRRSAPGEELSAKENPVLDADDVARWLDVFEARDKKKD